MLMILALCALAGFACGLLLLNWFGLALVSVAVSVASLFAIRWDLLFIPKWCVIVTTLQFAWLAGNIVRLAWDERDRRAAERHSPDRFHPER